MRIIIITILVLFHYIFILPNSVYPDWDAEIQISVPDTDSEKTPIDYKEENNNSNRDEKRLGRGRSFLNIIAFFLPLIWLIFHNKRFFIKNKGNKIKMSNSR
ncbi:MAG: hypothetical protein ACE5EA_04405 [Nitrospirota bacterium]